VEARPHHIHVFGVGHVGAVVEDGLEFVGHHGRQNPCHWWPVELWDRLIVEVEPQSEVDLLEDRRSTQGTQSLACEVLRTKLMAQCNRPGHDFRLDVEEKSLELEVREVGLRLAPREVEVPP